MEMATNASNVADGDQNAGGENYDDPNQFIAPTGIS
jgi:hypothetical protein